MEEIASKNDLKVETRIRTEPVRRHSIILRGKKTYIIAIHDPISRPLPLPAESITGADYVVEFPFSLDEDKLILVQLKPQKYGVPPKQYFGMGAFYMYAQYLADKWYWTDRFHNGVEYVTKRRTPHNEFLFVKIIEDDVYIPMSSIFRTFKPTNCRFSSNLSTTPFKSGDIIFKETAKYVDFYDPRQHISEYYVGFSNFMNAVSHCEIGMRHELSVDNVQRKLDCMFFLSEMLFRPNIVLIETYHDILGTISL
jgi:hypothetical protein